MKQICLALVAIALLSGCINTQVENKTPYTKIGQLNSCMLDEGHRRKQSGELANPKLDVWSTARSMLRICRSKLDISSNQIIEPQSLNIAVSIINSLR